MRRDRHHSGLQRSACVALVNLCKNAGNRALGITSALAEKLIRDLRLVLRHHPDDVNLQLAAYSALYWLARSSWLVLVDAMVSSKIANEWPGAIRTCAAASDYSRYSYESDKLTQLLGTLRDLIRIDPTNLAGPAQCHVRSPGADTSGEYSPAPRPPAWREHRRRKGEFDCMVIESGVQEPVCRVLVERDAHGDIGNHVSSSRNRALQILQQLATGGSWTSRRRFADFMVESGLIGQVAQLEQMLDDGGCGVGLAHGHASGCGAAQAGGSLPKTATDTSVTTFATNLRRLVRDVGRLSFKQAA